MTLAPMWKTDYRTTRMGGWRPSEGIKKVQIRGDRTQTMVITEEVVSHYKIQNVRSRIRFPNGSDQQFKEKKRVKGPKFLT